MLLGNQAKICRQIRRNITTIEFELMEEKPNFQVIKDLVMKVHAELARFEKEAGE